MELLSLTDGNNRGTRMRIAVMNHVVNAGGGVRYDRALLIAIRKIRPDIDITYFTPGNKLKFEGIYTELSDAGINIKPVSHAIPLLTRIVYSINYWVSGGGFLYGDHIVGKILNGIKKKVKGSLSTTHKLDHYDLVFFTWPYFMDCPDLICPIFFIPHDFNYKYFFGAHIYRKETVDILTHQHEMWLEKAKPIVSTHFMASELGKFYPKYKDKISVVHLAPFSLSNHSEEKAFEIVQKLGIDYDYILYPCNTTYHKNLGVLISAVYILNKRGKNIKLVYVGYDTQDIKGKADYVGVESNDKDFDVIGLGYVSNDEIDALIKHAKAVVSPSLYEAGNGPGLDAWMQGTPVAMSDIPAFIEHMQIQGVRARVFDPKNPYDIAEKIEWILDHPRQAKEDAMYSAKKIREWSWENVARKYIQIFENGIKK